MRHFLEDFEANGKFSGFPSLGVEWQSMENPDLRKAFKMGSDMKGILVKSILPTSDSAAHLHNGDVILRFDDVEIANDGTVPFRSGERISFSHLITSRVAHPLVI
jgi:S1-C subfamily serine protease